MCGEALKIVLDEQIDQQLDDTHPLLLPSLLPTSSTRYPSLASGPIDSTTDDRLEHYSTKHFQWLFT